MFATIPSIRRLLMDEYIEGQVWLAREMVKTIAATMFERPGYKPADVLDAIMAGFNDAVKDRMEKLDRELAGH